MPVEPSELADFIGIDLSKIENKEKLKETFDGTFVRRDLAHDDKGIADKVFGKINDILRRKLAKQAKELGVDGKFDEINPDEGIELLSTSLKGRIDAVATELAEAKKGGKSTKEVEELTKTLADLKKENEAFKSNAGEWETKYKTLEGTITQEKQKARIDGVFERAFESVKLRDDIGKFAQTGFKNHVRENYKIEFGEEGVVKVLDRDGKIVMDPNKAQTFRSLDSIVSELAEKEKLTGAASAPVKKVVTPTQIAMSGNAQQPPATGGNARPGRRVMPV